MQARPPTGFTLVELLVAVALISLLAALAATTLPQAKLAARRAASANNLRELGTALMSFAQDNQDRLPGRVQSSDKWPRLLLPYLGGGVKVLGEPDDPECFLRTGANPLDNDRNQTSYILNGFNDAGAFGNEEISVRLLSLERPVHTVLMSGQSGTGNFYMDFAEGNQSDVLNKAAYGDGSNYLFPAPPRRSSPSARKWRTTLPRPLPPSSFPWLPRPRWIRSNSRWRSTDGSTTTSNRWNRFK